ncbi:hypothetical protein CTEN210_18578 [Chaetoceros tenuissimus]|uniref:DUF819 domain-containing protein n=1 Tax=Chaetoceros tenuissimus TaxID=426638 RepID=A0AAD3HFK7_9STRA|nr:hypothetical protein CTEN210_18578 [Chaetoceros tenuissimus]
MPRSHTRSHMLSTINKNIKSTTGPLTQLNATPISTIASSFANLHKDNFYVMSIIMLVSTLGIKLEQETKFGKTISAPLLTMGMALLIANLNIIPFASSVYSFINSNLVALAIPCLLLDSNLKRVVKDSGSLLQAFFIAGFSTIIATFITFPLIPLKSLGDEGWKVAAALAARHIGGAINFVAVSESLSMNGSAVSAAIAADNVVVALYFLLLFSLAKEGSDEQRKNTNDSDNDVQVRDPEDASSNGNSNISLATIATTMTLATSLVTLGKIATKILFPQTSALPMISILTVIAATFFPSFFQHHATTGTAIGVLFMQMFFAASGAVGSIKLVMQQAPSLFLFSIMQVAIHFLSLVGIGKYIFKLKANELYLASNAAVGGPTTAAAMAQAKNWKALVLPALLVGILGYATATPIALGLGHLLLKLPTLT